MEQLLRSESKDLLHKYVATGVLSKGQAWDLVNSKDAEGLMLAMQSFITIDEQVELRIWKHVIHNVWKGMRNDDELASVFSPYESIFFRELLRKKGVMTREYTIKLVCGSQDMNDRVAQRLVNRGIVDAFKLKKFNVIYLLNLEFYQQVMQE